MDIWVRLIHLDFEVGLCKQIYETYLYHANNLEIHEKILHQKQDVCVKHRCPVAKKSIYGKNFNFLDFDLIPSPGAYYAYKVCE